MTLINVLKFLGADVVFVWPAVMGREKRERERENLKGGKDTNHDFMGPWGGGHQEQQRRQAVLGNTRASFKAPQMAKPFSGASKHCYSLATTQTHFCTHPRTPLTIPGWATNLNKWPKSPLKRQNPATSRESFLSVDPDFRARPTSLCHRTNVLMLFIGLAHLKSRGLVDGPLWLMGNSIILGWDWQSLADREMLPLIDALQRHSDAPLHQISHLFMKYWYWLLHLFLEIGRLVWRGVIHVFVLTSRWMGIVLNYLEGKQSQMVPVFMHVFYIIPILQSMAKYCSVSPFIIGVMV